MFRPLDTRVVLLGIIALAIATFDAPRASDPGTHAKAIAGGKVAVETGWVAAQTCWTFDGATEGAPAGLVEPDATLPVTMRVKRSGDLCGQSLTPVKARFEVADRPGTHAVMIYVVAGEKLMATQRTAIRR